MRIKLFNPIVLVFLSFCLLISCKQTPKYSYNEEYFNYYGGAITVTNSSEYCLLFIDGSINDEFVPEFNLALNNLLKRRCNQKIVLLNSNGGNVSIAMKSGEMIRSLNLNTQIFGKCESACILIFIGGKERFVVEGNPFSYTRFGFHQMGIKTLNEKKCLNETTISEKMKTSFITYLEKMLPKNAANDLYQLTMSTDCNHLNNIFITRLVENKTITQVLPRSTFENYPYLQKLQLR